MIGIISDTHNDEDAVKMALQTLKDCGLIVHCGDITTPDIMQLFKGTKTIFVKGNSDIYIKQLTKKAKEINVEFYLEYAEFKHGNKMFAALHGDDDYTFEKLIKSGKYDYILRGHTHLKGTAIVGSTTIINPGALSGHEKSFAIIDKNKIKFIEVDNNGRMHFL